jgi:hypothetical protein
MPMTRFAGQHGAVHRNKLSKFIKDSMAPGARLRVHVRAGGAMAEQSMTRLRLWLFCSAATLWAAGPVMAQEVLPKAPPPFAGTIDPSRHKAVPA